MSRTAKTDGRRAPAYRPIATATSAKPKSSERPEGSAAAAEKPRARPPGAGAAATRVRGALARGAATEAGSPCRPRLLASDAEPQDPLCEERLSDPVPARPLPRDELLRDEPVDSPVDAGRDRQAAPAPELVAADLLQRLLRERLEDLALRPREVVPDAREVGILRAEDRGQRCGEVRL